MDKTIGIAQEIGIARRKWINDPGEKIKSGCLICNRVIIMLGSQQMGGIMRHSVLF